MSEVRSDRCDEFASFYELLAYGRRVTRERDALLAAVNRAYIKIAALTPSPDADLPSFGEAIPKLGDAACIGHAFVALRSAIRDAEGGK